MESNPQNRHHKNISFKRQGQANSTLFCFCGKNKFSPAYCFFAVNPLTEPVLSRQQIRAGIFLFSGLSLGLACAFL